MSALRTLLRTDLFPRGRLGPLAAAALLTLAGLLCRAETKTSVSGSVDSGTANRTANGGTLTAGAEGAANAEASSEYSNCGEGDLGGTDLNSGKTVASGAVTLLNSTDSIGGDHANLGYSAQAGASGELQFGSNGAQASGEIGLTAELNALAQYGVGDENFGGGAAAEAQVSALLRAQATVGAYIDSTGLTIGLDAKAEAMVSAEASLSLSLTLFGIQTTVTATASGQAGASASASAIVTIGFDGKIYFRVGAGATAGIGGGVSFNAAVDAQQLMQNLGFESLDQLIGWCEQLANDPAALAEQLARDAASDLAGALVDQVKEEALGAARDLASSAFDLAGNVCGSCGGLPGGGPLASLGSGLQSLFGGSQPSVRPPSASGTGGSGGGGTPSGSTASGAGGSGQSYRRDSQFNSWSK